MVLLVGWKITRGEPFYASPYLYCADYSLGSTINMIPHVYLPVPSLYMHCCMWHPAFVQWALFGRTGHFLWSDIVGTYSPALQTSITRTSASTNMLLPEPISTKSNSSTVCKMSSLHYLLPSIMIMSNLQNVSTVLFRSNTILKGPNRPSLQTHAAQSSEQASAA